MDCVCEDVDMDDVFNSLSHVVRGFSALTCGGTTSRMKCHDLGDEMLNSIDQKLVNALAHARMLRNALSRINQLPPEILGRIFGAVSDPCIPSARTRTRSDSWVVVQQVCRYWHVLAMSTPSLWTDIDILDSHDDDPASLPRRSLILSREAPLTVHIQYPRVHAESAVYRELLGQMSRVRELYLYGVRDVDDLADFNALPAPQLTTFVVHAVPGESKISLDSDEAQQLPPLFASHAPRLNLLGVDKFRMSPRNLRSFTCLRYLWLQPDKCILPHYLHSLLVLLDSNPTLEDLIIEGVVLESPPFHTQARTQVPPYVQPQAERRVALPDIRRIVFSLCDAGFVALLLSHLTLPDNTVMRLVACTARGANSSPLLPPDISYLANVASVTALALRLGGDTDRHICAVSRGESPSSQIAQADVGARSGSALWISDRTYGDGWIIDQLCPSLPLAQIEELWLSGFDNRSPQSWHNTFFAMPCLATLVLTDAKWNADDWFCALSMPVPVDSAAGPDKGMMGDRSKDGVVCPALRELHVRAPSLALLSTLGHFVRDRARRGRPLAIVRVMFLPGQPEIVQLCAQQADGWRRLVMEEVTIEVVEQFPKMVLPRVCTRSSGVHGLWHDTID